MSACCVRQQLTAGLVVKHEHSLRLSPVSKAFYLLNQVQGLEMRLDILGQGLGMRLGILVRTHSSQVHVYTCIHV